MDWLTLAIGVVAIAALVGMMQLVRASRRVDPLDVDAIAPGERREPNRLFLRMLDELVQIDGHYERFTRRVLYGLAILSVTTVAALVVTEVLIVRNRHAIAEIHQTTLEACGDIENVKTDVRDTLDQLVPDVRERAAAAAKFARQTCPHQKLP